MSYEKITKGFRKTLKQCVVHMTKLDKKKVRLSEEANRLDNEWAAAHTEYQKTENFFNKLAVLVGGVDEVKN